MKITSVILTFIACFCITLQAQNSQNTGQELMKQAQTRFEQKDYAKARQLFLQAYEGFANTENYAMAAESGTKAVSLFYKDNLYKEAFDLCRQIDQLIMTGSQQLKKSMPELHFKVAKERLQMYIQLKNAAQAQGQIERLKSWAAQANTPALSEELLYTQATFYYTFGQMREGDACFQQLIAKYKEKKEFDKVSDCYKQLISIASKAGNAPLVGQTYEKYIVWTDSVKALKAKDEYNLLKQKYDESLQTIQDKDDTLSGKQYMIVALFTFVIILIAVLLLGVVLLLRFITLNKKLKKNIEIANEHNELKTQFIQNISAQMAPTLNNLETAAGGLVAASPQQAGHLLMQVKALKDFTHKIQELSTLENSLMETYEVQPINVSTFSKNVIEKVRGNLNPGVELAIDAASLEIKSNAEQLERILLHLLDNAAKYTTTGKIKLEFKKRGAHICQFIITDTGSGIAAERRDNLFKPFSEIKDLTDGDGLGLPICSLIATKLNGSLSIDPEYTRGCRFILGLNV